MSFCLTLDVTVIYLLLYIGVTVLCFFFFLTTTDKSSDGLHTKHEALKAERDQLWTNLSSGIKITVHFQHIPVCAAEQVCPERWNSFKFSCYYISNEEKNWDDSRQYCTDRGADLVIIDSKEEQAFIDLFNGYFWIGLSDKEREGTWKWVDETRLMEPEPNKRWNDLSCDSVLRWICEKKSQ
uniref:C-type lectin domain-containing protein n=1 Tax=Scleropages formosus TaxID=113540 RepID=A0A8C9V7L7_SCLFO